MVARVVSCICVVPRVHLLHTWNWDYWKGNLFLCYKPKTYCNIYRCISTVTVYCPAQWLITTSKWPALWLGTSWCYQICTWITGVHSMADIKYQLNVQTLSTGHLCHCHFSISCSDCLLGQSPDSAWGKWWLNISLHSKCKFALLIDTVEHFHQHLMSIIWKQTKNEYAHHSGKPWRTLKSGWMLPLRSFSLCLWPLEDLLPFPVIMHRSKSTCNWFHSLYDAQNQKKKQCRDNILSLQE